MWDLILKLISRITVSETGLKIFILLIEILKLLILKLFFVNIHKSAIFDKYKDKKKNRL
jgi:hypothetical protein